MIIRKRCRVDSPRPRGNNLRNGHERLPRPRDPEVPDLHTARIKARASASFGLSSHPKTRPAATSGKRRFFIYTLGQGVGLFLPLRRGVFSRARMQPESPRTDPPDQARPGCIFLCIIQFSRDYLVKLFNNSYIIRIWIPINFPWASNHLQLTLVINAIHH